MRAWLAATAAALALCASPALAQKTKSPAAPQSVAALEVCEQFARGDVLAVDNANAKGWDAYATDTESPYVRSYSASRDLPGIGLANLFALVEDYPETTFGYCRLDVMEPTGRNGAQQIEAIQGLDRYEGTGETVSDGTFASLKGTSETAQSLLLAHWTETSFVIQLTVITPTATAETE
ncbi:hypothetical protein ACFSX5_04255 [Devosia albogilva]|uniref:Uncharacterized protein n=1 Tax=Devosia albogilva TaxID=429726 RepID=A0ABW5QHF1_9HYPH